MTEHAKKSDVNMEYNNMETHARDKLVLLQTVSAMVC